MKVKRFILILCGWLSLGLGIIGIFLPLLPTTPFLLLSATCFARSSDRFNHWLLNNRVFGRYICDYREGKGVPLRARMTTLVILWLSILATAAFINAHYVLKISLIIIAGAVTVHILLIKDKQDQR